MSFSLYLIGFVLVIAGIAWGLSTAGLAPVYIAIACLILAGIGVITGVAKTRTKDVSH